VQSVIRAIDTLEQQQEDDSVQKAIDILKAIVDDCQCPVCLEHLTDTHVHPECLHRLCGNCIEESLRNCNKECPTRSCRIKLPQQSALRKDKQFDHIVSAHTRTMCINSNHMLYGIHFAQQTNY